MVTPITTVTKREEPGSLTGTPGQTYRYTVGRRQTLPIDKTMVLPYTLIKAVFAYGQTDAVMAKFYPNRKGWPDNFWVGSGTGAPQCVVAHSLFAQPTIETDKKRAVNIARDKFISKMGDSAMLAVNLAERRQAMEMCVTRLGQVTTAYRDFRHIFTSGFTPREIHGYLSHHYYGPASLKRRAKEMMEGWRGTGHKLGSLWLEYHFGWEPLVKDIFTAVDILLTIPQEISIKEKSKWLSNDFVLSSKTAYVTMRGEFKSRSRAIVFADFLVNNVEQFRATQLGLTNPAAWAWELIPFSFLVDWFVSVGDALAQLDQFHGITLKNAGYSTITKVTGFGRSSISYQGERGECWAISAGTEFQRFNTFPYASIGLRPWKDISPVRGLTAIALLLQVLKKK